MRFSAFPPADKARLVAIIRQFDDPEQGARIAAVLAATRFLHSRGVTWVDFTQPLLAPAQPEQPSQLPWRDQIDFCLRHPDALSEWESEFLASLRRFPNASRKQLQILDRIAERVLSRGDR